jgi:hypothetical protein
MSEDHAFSESFCLSPSSKYRGLSRSFLTVEVATTPAPPPICRTSIRVFPYVFFAYAPGPQSSTFSDSQSQKKAPLVKPGKLNDPQPKGRQTKVWWSVLPKDNLLRWSIENTSMGKVHSTPPRQVRESFVNIRRPFGSFRRALDCSDYRLDCMKGAAIADPETGSNPSNLLTAMHSGSSANCSFQKIWNRYSFTFMIELTSVVISERFRYHILDAVIGVYS